MIHDYVSIHAFAGDKPKVKPMPKKTKEEFREKYGIKQKPRVRYQRAIRAECPGASKLLDLLEQVSGMRQTASGHTLDLLTEIEDGVQCVRDEMVEAVRKEWTL